MPHPFLHQRRFVLEPLAELAPFWMHPVLKETVSALLQQVKDPGKIVKLTETSA